MEVKNIDVAVIDRDNSVESRELVSRFQNSTHFRHIIYVDNEKTLKDNIDRQRVLVGLYIDNNFSTSVKAQKSVNVSVLLDGRQTNSASIASGYATQIITNYSNELVKKKSANVNIVVRNWYNPNLEYQWYILTVLVAMLAVVITLILTSLSIAREKEMGTFDQLIVSPLSSFEILFGKTVPPMAIAMCMTCIMVMIVTKVFSLPFNGSVLLLLLSLFVSLLSIVGVGLFISSICRTQQQAILSVMTFMTPAMLLSGFISPISDMPQFLQYLTWFDPIRFFILLTRSIILKGMGIEGVLMNLIPLLFIATITLTLAGRTFKRKLD